MTARQILLMSIAERGAGVVLLALACTSLYPVALAAALSWALLMFALVARMVWTQWKASASSDDDGDVDDGDVS